MGIFVTHSSFLWRFFPTLEAMAQYFKIIIYYNQTTQLICPWQIFYINQWFYNKGGGGGFERILGVWPNLKIVKIVNAVFGFDCFQDVGTTIRVNGYNLQTWDRINILIQPGLTCSYVAQVWSSRLFCSWLGLTSIWFLSWSQRANNRHNGSESDFVLVTFVVELKTKVQTNRQKAKYFHDNVYNYNYNGLTLSHQQTIWQAEAADSSTKEWNKQALRTQKSD